MHCITKRFLHENINLYWNFKIKRCISIILFHELVNIHFYFCISKLQVTTCVLEMLESNRTTVRNIVPEIRNPWTAVIRTSAPPGKFTNTIVSNGLCHENITYLELELARVLWRLQGKPLFTFLSLLFIENPPF